MKVNHYDNNKHNKLNKVQQKIKDSKNLNKNIYSHVKQNQKYLEQENNGYLVADDGEFTNKMSQDYLKDYLPKANADNIFSLKLPNGPYNVSFPSNGNTLLLNNKQGFLSAINWREKKMLYELNLDEKIGKTEFINGDKMLAVSHEKRLNIYDNQGIEIHSMDNYAYPIHLVNLQYHFLLCVSSKNK